MLNAALEAEEKSGARSKTGYAEAYELNEVPTEIQPPLLLSDEALPEGLSLAQAKVHVKQPLESPKNPPNTLVAFHSDEDKHLTLETSPPPPAEQRPVPLAVEQGRIRPSDRVNGHFIRGEWLSEKTEDGEVDLAWKDEFALKLMAFEHGCVIRLKGHPASAFSEEELLKIAESLGPYNRQLQGG